MKRYGAGARWYDVLSGERFVYRAGRLAGIDALELRAGAAVLDVGCGTGLDFTPLLERVGRGGTVLGVDFSADMLAQARSRIADHGWTNVELRQGDAGDLDGLVGTRADFDAAVFSYSLSIVDRWRDAYAQALALVRPGGRIAVVDMALPVGRWRVFAPLARLACWTGGADITRAPWTLVPRTTTASIDRTLRGGHVHVAAGTRS